ncbi:MAG TPA: ABC transporter ATP-binding protein [Candidatus Omnitrophota bacterium]|nr:ABC transporter ATP-binding protein [Candidatus Omnitrophota bacterium]
MNPTVITARGIKKIYRLPAEDIYAVNHIDLEIRRGDYVALMGPSGSGKTTLLDILGCMDSPTQGDLTVLGHDVSGKKEGRLVHVRRGNIGFVFQDFLLIPTLTALENVEMPLYFARKPIEREKCVGILKKVGLGHRIDHLPKQMSGGEKQRVAIARALVASPAILIADEPTGNLDSKNSQEIFEVLRKLNDEGLTIIVATHDEQLGKQAQRVIHLTDGKITN